MLPSLCVLSVAVLHTWRVLLFRVENVVSLQQLQRGIVAGPTLGSLGKGRCQLLRLRHYGAVNVYKAAVLLQDRTAR